MERNAYLVLEDGTVFKGKSFGAQGDAIAEVVFTTGMAGYLETLTDQSYRGQIILQTFPLIGDYGVIPDSFESGSIAAVGYIVKEWCREPSNFRCEGDIDALLKERGIVGLYGIDTRALTKVLRDKGTMNGMITDDPAKADLKKIAGYKIEGAVEASSVKEAYTVSASDPKYTVALIDTGVKKSIINALCKRGCDVHVFPCTASVDEILSDSPDGIVLPNGAGDPKDNTELIARIKKLTKSGIPTFGIGLGHQLLALANGFDTDKLHHGHRGSNQPVRDCDSGKLYIAGQNHGYIVKSDSINKRVAREIFVNIYDSTNEGIEYLKNPGISVQFYPGECGGPKETDFVFDRFISLVDDYKRSSTEE